MTSRPVVCLIDKYPFARQSGSTSYLRVLGYAAGRAGLVPHVFCVGPRTGTHRADFGVVHVVRAPGGPDWPVLDSQAPLFAPWLVPALVRFAAPLREPVILHGLSVWGWIGLVAARRLRRRGWEAVPVVSAYDTKAEQQAGGRGGLATLPGRRARLSWRVRGVWETQGVRLFERPTYTRSRLVLVNYARVERLLAATFGSRVPLRRVPCAPESAFRHEPLPPGRGAPPSGLGPLADPAAPLVVSVSRHALHKGLDVLIEALAALRAGGLRFRACLLGPGTLTGAHRLLARSRGLEGTVPIPGQVPDPFAYLRHADVFVLPSRGEGGSGSMALLEALQAGVAVVASACDGIPEDVEDGRDALLVPPGDVGALARALARVLPDPGLRRRLATNARATFERRFSADGLVTALRRVYGELGVRPA